MKEKQYERKQCITAITILFLLLEVLASIYLFTKKEFQYQRLSGIVLQENYVLFIVNSKEKELLYKNQQVIWKGKLKKYKIQENKGVLYKKDNKKQYEIIMKLKTEKNQKLNDVMYLSIKTEKKRIIEILKEIWGGD